VTISTPYLVNVIKITLRLLNGIENDLQDTYMGEIKITEPKKLLEIFAFIKDKTDPFRESQLSYKMLSIMLVLYLIIVKRNLSILFNISP